jgi:glycosyltransferase involved in cell wall biosynthesis
MKKVSVIIPVYNVEKYISATVQSVLDQTYKNFELLIVDDGSPDRSIEICQQFDDPRIRIIRQPNRGVAAARNAGIRQAEGEYIALLDADDLWVPQKLEKHVEHLNSMPGVGVSFCRSAFIDPDDKPLGIYQIHSAAPQSEMVQFQSFGARFLRGSNFKTTSMEP